MTTYWDPCGTATYGAGGLSGLTAAFANEPRLPCGIKQANSTSADEMAAKITRSTATTFPVEPSGPNSEPTINIAERYTAYTTTRRIGKHKHVCEHDQCTHTVSITEGQRMARSTRMLSKNAYHDCRPRQAVNPTKFEHDFA